MHSSLITSRKPRCDSPLRMLPWERQKQIIASLQAKSQKDVLSDLLHTDRIRIKAAALSRFSKWHHARAEAFGDLVHDWLQKLQNLDTALQNPMPGANKEAIIDLGLRLICARALEDMDASELVRQKRVQQRDKMAELHERRVAIVERKEEAGYLKAEHEAELDTIRARELCAQLPVWCEAEAKKNEPKVVTIEEAEAAVRKSFDLPPKPKAPAPQPEGSSACRPGAPTGRPQSSPDDPWAPRPQPQPPQPAAVPPSPVAALGTAPHSHPPQPAQTPQPAAQPPVSQAPNQPASALHSELKTENCELKTPSTIHSSPVTHHSPKSLDEMEESKEMLETYGACGDKFLMLTGEGLELYSKKNYFLPKRIHKWFAVTPDLVRQAIKDLHAGRL